MALENVRISKSCSPQVCLIQIGLRRVIHLICLLLLAAFLAFFLIASDALASNSSSFTSSSSGMYSEYDSGGGLPTSGAYSDSTSIADITRCPAPANESYQQNSGYGSIDSPYVLREVTVYNGVKTVKIQKRFQTVRFFELETSLQDVRVCSEIYSIDNKRKTYTWNPDPAVCNWTFRDSFSNAQGKSITANLVIDPNVSEIIGEFEVRQDDMFAENSLGLGEPFYYFSESVTSSIDGVLKSEKEVEISGPQRLVLGMLESESILNPPIMNGGWDYFEWIETSTMTEMAPNPASCVNTTTNSLFSIGNDQCPYTFTAKGVTVVPHRPFICGTESPLMRDLGNPLPPSPCPTIDDCLFDVTDLE